MLGGDHPNTLVSQAALARTFMLQGDNERALRLYEQVYEARCRVLGPDHERTVQTRERIEELRGGSES